MLSRQRAGVCAMDMPAIVTALKIIDRLQTTLRDTTLTSKSPAPPRGLRQIATVTDCSPAAVNITRLVQIVVNACRSTTIDLGSEQLLRTPTNVFVCRIRVDHAVMAI
jgi:hypothetical protein